MKTVVVLLACVVVYVASQCNTIDTSSTSAPKPTVTASASGSTITIAVTMARQTADNTGTPVWHNVDTTELNSNTCKTTAGDVTPTSIGQPWVPSQGTCSTTYTLTQTLAQIVGGGADNHWSQSLAADGRSITYTVPVYSTYSVNLPNNGGCYFVGYRVLVSFRTQLSISSTSTVITADNTAKFQIIGLRITPDSEFEITALITPLIPNSILQNIGLKKSAGPVPLPIAPSATCSTYNVACTRTFKTATTNFAAYDISGQFQATLDIYENGVNTKPGQIFTWTINYIIPTDPNVVDSDTITTSQTAYTDGGFGTVRTATYKTDNTDNLFLENTVASAVPIPSKYRLRMSEGYLCCYQYLNSIPAYSPANGGSGGCKTNTVGDGNMLQWVNLGTDVSPGAVLSGVQFTPADATNYKRYRLQVPFATYFTGIFPRPTMSCQVLLISKFTDSTVARGVKVVNYDSQFVSTIPFNVDEPQKTSISGASTASVAIITFLVVLFNMML